MEEVVETVNEWVFEEVRMEEVVETVSEWVIEEVSEGKEVSEWVEELSELGKDEMYEWKWRKWVNEIKGSEWISWWNVRMKMKEVSEWY